MRFPLVRRSTLARQTAELERQRGIIRQLESDRDWQQARAARRAELSGAVFTDAGMASAFAKSVGAPFVQRLPDVEAWIVPLEAHMIPALRPDLDIRPCD